VVVRLDFYYGEEAISKSIIETSPSFVEQSFAGYGEGGRRREEEGGRREKEEEGGRRREKDEGQRVVVRLDFIMEKRPSRS
jgi:hypothetical protein